VRNLPFCPYQILLDHGQVGRGGGMGGAYSVGGCAANADVLVEKKT
jgi:hypothetical protein